jgi:hypothetical protein
MKNFFLLLFLSLAYCFEAQSFDIKLLVNNKESYSRLITNLDMEAVELWMNHHQLTRDEIKTKSKTVLQKVITHFTKRETLCDLGLATMLYKASSEESLIANEEDFSAYLSYMRMENIIDDIFYRLLNKSHAVNADMNKYLRSRVPRRPLNLYTNQNAGIDLKDFYSTFNNWPDDVEYCTLGRYWRLVNKLKWSNSKDLDSQMRKLNWMGVSFGVIDLETFNKLEVLRHSRVLDWHVNINGYLDIVRNAKDKLAIKVEEKSTNNFNETYVSRRDKLTRRGKLYKVYSSTQVMVLAQLIEKTARRIDARYASINFQYTDDPEGEIETYVLSPMEQYRLSIRMLRKEMAEIMRSQSFAGTGIEFNDIISAAFETGMINSEELDYVVKFEDFWNPKTPKWKAYANFAFSLAGTASYYLPPPWNIIGAIGLVVTQSRYMNDDEPDPDNNWNAVL